MGERSAVVFKTLVAIGGAAASYLFGGWSALLGVLITLVCLDVALGMLVAAVTGKLASKRSFIGIAKKVALFTLVAVAHLLDIALGNPDTLRDVVICFYIAHESLSIIENAGLLNLPIPAVLQRAVEVLNAKSEGK